ncbi:hypothetical protein T440DRAFT_471898 [Plenodomus tracheiphilus IPT5]|uniref:Uncharacterized protein n=1 Tax=Plenodomus tracheiphilus IPT5 TaxID=1408161 RepID=A0A6A7AWD0_9PLEO|nr:hypothetical protein T440DRAFT_471898 [Plenodomus tracheiphilus IPT5]
MARPRVRQIPLRNSLYHTTKNSYVQNRRTPSPTSCHLSPSNLASTLPSVSRGFRRPVWLRPCIQYMWDRDPQVCFEPDDPRATLETRPLGDSALSSDDNIRPKRRLCMFVKDEELESFREVQADTPHGSELQDFVDVFSPATVIELYMDALALEATSGQGCASSIGWVEATGQCGSKVEEGANYVSSF